MNNQKIFILMLWSSITIIWALPIILHSTESWIKIYIGFITTVIIVLKYYLIKDDLNDNYSTK